MTDLALLEKEAKSKKTSASRPEELSRHSDSSVQRAVAGNPNTPVAALEFPARATQRNLLKALVKNPNTPLNVLERLARHQQVAVRRAVAESSFITEAMAFQLLSDVDDGVRCAVLPMFERFAWKFTFAAKDSSSRVRTRVAQCCADPTILKQLLSDPAG